MKNTLFPIFLKTDAARFLIIGGGNVGLEKTQTLLRQNPLIDITIVSIHFSNQLKELLNRHSHIIAHQREFKENDLESMNFVITATNNPELNRDIKYLANQRNILVNAADEPKNCNFYLGSIITKGNLKIAISTNGKSPVLARRMREYLEETIPNSIDNTITNLNEFRNNHQGDFKEKLTDLNRATATLAANQTKKEAKKYKRLVFEISLLFIVFFIGYGLSTFISVPFMLEQIAQIPNEFYAMILVGFVAQLVDGALGLGYGVTCATSMMLFGIKLPAISGSIHTAEMFSSAISGYNHYKFGNVNKKLLFWLAVPGIIGATAGALALIYLGSRYETLAYALLSFYTLIIGIRLIVLAFRKVYEKKPLKRVGILGFSGGFFDAFGGGGWGPLVTSTLLAKGRKVNFVIGTVSLAEFFVTLTAAIIFFFSLGVTHWYIVLGLIIGGAISAPFAARLAGRLSKKTALLCVAFLVIIFSLRILIKLI